MRLALTLFRVRTTAAILGLWSLSTLITLIMIMAEVSALAAFVLTKEATLGSKVPFSSALLTLSFQARCVLIRLMIGIVPIVPRVILFFSFRRCRDLLGFASLLEIVLLRD
jgi:hypothetical protein